MITIGILAIQGAFIEHAHKLAKLGVKTFEIRQKKGFIDSHGWFDTPRRREYNHG